MFKKIIIGLIAAIALPMQATVVSINQGDFAGHTVEDFNPSSSGCNGLTTYDFGNGMVHTNLNSQGDCVNYNSSYGMGTETSVSSGKDGSGDGYFGTGPTPTSFELAFAAGISQFGFFGAESAVSGGSAQRNGELDLEFYDMSNNLIAAISVSTLGTFAWDQFHGFQSSSLLSRVVFTNVGHMVLDDVHFSSTNVPEPSSLLIVLLGLIGFGARQLRK